MTIKTELKIGDWLLIDYGFNARKFTVISIAGDKVFLASPSWCSSDVICLTVDDLLSPHYNARYLGSSKRKWYWRFLPWREIIHPFYKPKR